MRHGLIGVVHAKDHRARTVARAISVGRSGDKAATLPADSRKMLAKGGQGIRFSKPACISRLLICNFTPGCLSPLYLCPWPCAVGLSNLRPIVNRPVQYHRRQRWPGSGFYFD